MDDAERARQGMAVRREVLGDEHVDRAVAATKGLPLAEHVSSLLAGVLGGAQAHDLVAEAGARATSAGLPLRDVLLTVPKLEERLSAAGITAEQIDSALEPSGYLGAADVFVTAALDAHEALGVRHG